MKLFRVSLSLRLSFSFTLFSSFFVLFLCRFIIIICFTVIFYSLCWRRCALFGLSHSQKKKTYDVSRSIAYYLHRLMVTKFMCWTIHLKITSGCSKYLIIGPVLRKHTFIFTLNFFFFWLII